MALMLRRSCSSAACRGVGPAAAPAVAGASEAETAGCVSSACCSAATARATGCLRGSKEGLTCQETQLPCSCRNPEPIV